MFCGPYRKHIVYREITYGYLMRLLNDLEDHLIGVIKDGLLELQLLGFVEVLIKDGM